MMNMTHWRSERGQIVPIVAAMVLFMMGMLAVAGDTGFVWMQRRNLQNSADAAALAAAQALPEDRTTAERKAREYAKSNVDGITDADIDVCFEDSCTAATNPLSVKVTVRKKSESLFGVSLGFGNLDVSAKAKALVRGSPLGPGVVPLVTDVATAGLGGLIVLKEASPGSIGGSPFFGFANPCPAAPDNCKTNNNTVLCDYFLGGAINVQDPVQITPGNRSWFRSCLDQRLTRAAVGPSTTDLLGYSGACLSFTDVSYVESGHTYLRPHCNPLGDASASGSPSIQPTAVILIPVVVNFNCLPGSNGGNCQFDVVGSGTENRRFAYFWISGDSCSNPGQCTITGRFLENKYLPLRPSGSPVGTYDPLSTLKVVTLVE